jgi:hypothetical protein
MTIPQGLRVALAITYAVGIGAVIWLVYRPGGPVLHRSDREFFGLLLLLLSVPFTVIGALLMRPYIRSPKLGWWIAYHVALMFVVVLYVGFFLGVGVDSLEVLGGFLLLEFPADIVGFSTPVALIVASAPLIKSRRERLSIADSGAE